MKLTLPKSIILSVLSASTSFVASTLDDDDIYMIDRIVGGKPAKPGDYPYFVHMGRCGGALVAPDVVLTARHCGSFKGQDMIIGANKPGGSLAGGAQKRTCKKWVEDPSDSFSDIASDFALCKLDKPVEIDESKIKLELNTGGSVLEKGDDLLVMGLGRTSSGGSSPNVLHHVEVPYVTNEKCNKKHILDGRVTEKMLCAGFLKGGKDSCQGDSGGPIVRSIVNNDGTAVHTHVGVVSWGFGCALKNRPGVYARTSERSDWIMKTMCDDFESIASFCSNNPDPAPSMAPDPNPNESCKDSTDFLWNNRRNCKRFLVGRNKERVKKKCNKEYEGDFVYNWCPGSCAKKVGVGPCVESE